GAGLLIVFAGGTSVPVVIAGVTVAALGYGLKGSMHFAIQPDPVDYGEWKSGVNIAGTMSAVNGFIGKVGMAVASSVAAALLASSGYVANAQVQTNSALNAISAMYIWIPLATNILTIITFLMYDLDKKLPQINKELEERRLAER
ncbi:MAG: MFS transporter, partial [Paenibacillaceae bacterium]|nr:MFS transporter [Paenibacillaceae bacterium]